MSTIPYFSRYRSSVLSPTFMRTAVRRANRSFSKVIRSTYDGLPAYSLTRNYYIPRYTPRYSSYSSLASTSSVTIPRGYARPSYNPKTIYSSPIRHMPRLTYRIPSTYAPAPISSSYRGLSSGPRLWYGSSTPLASRYLALTDSSFIDYDSSLSKVTSELSRLNLQNNLKSTSTAVRLFPSSSRQIHVHLPHTPSKKLGLPDPIRRSGGTGYRSAYARQYQSRLESSAYSPRAHWSYLY